MPLAVVMALSALAADPMHTAATVHVLDNGLTVVLEESHRTDAVGLHLHYGVGSRDEQTGERGCAHLFEHLMFEGSTNVPGNTFDEWLTAAGGENNAFTSEDETAYHMSYPSGASDLALFLESDRMGFLSGGLTDDNLANQQKVVLQERAEGYAEPHGRDFDALSRLQFPPGHPYHVPVIGTVADIEGFRLEAVVGFWRRHYLAPNGVLGLVGHFDDDEMLARVRHWFADVPGGEVVPRIEAPETVDWPRADGLLQDAVEDWTVYLSWPGVPIGHPDEAALDLLGQVVSGGRGTRLDDRMYYRSSLATDAGAFSWSREIAGNFVVYLSTEGPTLPKVTKVAQKVLAGVVRHPPTEDELLRARRAIRARLLEQLEHPESRAEILVDCQRLTGDANCVAAEWARYEAVTAADVARVAQTFLVPERLVTLSVVPTGKGGALPGAQPVELP